MVEYSPWRLRCPSGRSARPSSSPAQTIRCSHTYRAAVHEHYAGAMRAISHAQSHACRRTRANAYIKALFCAASAARHAALPVSAASPSPTRRPPTPSRFASYTCAVHSTAPHYSAVTSAAADVGGCGTARLLARSTSRRLAAAGLSAHGALFELRAQVGELGLLRRGLLLEVNDQLVVVVLRIQRQSFAPLSIAVCGHSRAYPA